MAQSVCIRPFAPSDYEAVAAVVAAYPPEQLYDYEFRTAAEFRDFDEPFVAAGRPPVRYVAEDSETGRVAGFAHFFEIEWAPPPGRYWCVLRVHPDYLRCGLGRQLDAQLMSDLARVGAGAALAELHEDLADLVGALQRRGFREVLRSWSFALDTRQCDLAHHAMALERIAPLEITTLAEERARDSAWLAKLYDLHMAVSRDVPIPGHPHPSPPPEWLERHIAGSPAALPEACFIVRDGERYVGESYLHTSPDEPGVLFQKVTGVRPEYRGRGVAVALKVRTIEFARRYGYSEIQTVVESNNPSMLAINQKFGFVRRSGLILLERRVGGS